MIEFLLTTFYFVIFCFIISKIAFFKDDKIPTNWFIIIFGIKVFASVLLTLVYTYYYTDRAMADIFKYFDDSKIMFDTIKTNPLDFFKMLFGISNDTDYFTEKYYMDMKHWSRPYFNDLFSDTHTIIRLNTIIRFFSFGHFYVHNIFINFISLLGLTMLYKAFKPFLKKKEKILFHTLFLVPSILFWGSGLLKESIIFFALGLFFLNLFRLIQQFKVLFLILIIASLTLIIYTKFYLFITLTIPVLGYLLNRYFTLKKEFYGYLISFTLFIGTINISPLISRKIDFIKQITIKQQDFSHFVKIESAASSFLIPELTDGISILINIPNALLNTLIRPFLWECNSLFVWLSAVENIAVIASFTIAIVFRKKMSKSQQNIFYFNLIFVFCLFSLIGLTTPVFGAIMRYKIPGLILLLIALLLLVDIQKIKLKHPFLKKIL